MTINSSVAETKKHLSELIGRVAYGGERVIITKHGKPMVAIVPVEEMEANAAPREQDWLYDILGLCEDCPEVCDAIDEIYQERSQERSRPIPDLGFGNVND